MKKLILIPLLLLPTNAIAQDYGSKYDPNTGNHYSWNKGFSGNTVVRGSNTRTGNNWRTTIQPNGNMRGTDSQGHMWQYNDSTGFYQNYGTGKICTGKGALRQCY